MSKHPAGPWTTTSSTAFVISQGYLSHTNGYGSLPSPILSGFPVIETRSGVNNGGKTDVPSPATLDLVTTEAENWEATSYWWYGGLNAWITSTQIGAQNQPLTPVLADPTFASDSAFSKLLARQAATLQSLVSLGEMKETVGTLGFLCDVLAGRHNKAYQSLVDNLVKHKKGSTSDVIKLISDHWLEFQFGVLPTISDIENLVKGVQAIAQAKRVPLKQKASFTDMNTSSSVQYNVPYWTRTNQTVTNFSKVTAKFGYDISIQAQDTLSSYPEVFGLTFRNVVPSLYELMPYTWLLDYFTNVQDFVNLLAMHRGIAQNAYKVLVQESIKTTIDEPVYPSGNPAQFTFIHKKIGFIKQRKFHFERKPYNVDLYVPTFRFEHPSLRQAANVVALAASKLVKPVDMNTLFSNKQRLLINAGIRRLR